MLRLPFLVRGVTTAQTSDVFARLQHRLPHVLGHADQETSLDQLALDSLDVVELLCVTGEEFDVLLTPEELIRTRTIGDLAAIIAKRSATTRRGDR
jgi:acyl carrier protein